MLRLRQAQQADRSLLNQLLHSSHKTHTHLDWHAPQSWLGKKPFQIVFKGDAAVAALAAPPDPSDTSWIRLAALAEGNELHASFDLLWPATLQTLRELRVTQIACMLLEDWFVPQLQHWQFQQFNDVIVLMRPLGTHSPSRPVLKGLKTRPARTKDLEAIEQVDAAFNTPWRYSKDTLTQAMSQVEFASVAELNGELVGYQLSSGGRAAGHLARLAVCPAQQGKGIGHALMAEITRHFDQLGAPQITVNTQHDNFSSLALYRAHGFSLTGEHYPVWRLRL